MITYRKFVTPIYLLNMTVQALVSLASPIGIGIFSAWLLDKYTEVGPWIYVVLIVLGVLLGLYSMISFILKASRAIEALEKQHKEAMAAASKTKEEEGGSEDNE
jgi:F0F1-type ATP synthase assembly protein I